MRLILTATAAALLTAFAHAAPIPAAAFAEFDQFSTPRLSPDGKHIAVNVRMKRGDRTVPILTIYALPDLKIVSQMGLKGYELMYNYHWVSNRRLVGDKALEVGLREAPQSTGEIIAFDFDGKNVEYLYGYDMYKSSTRGDRYQDDYGWADVNTIPHELNDHVFVEAHLWEGNSSNVLDINTKTAIRKTVTILPERRFSFVLQDDGTPRFALGRDDSDEDVLYRRDAGDWKKQSSELARSFFPIGITTDNKAAYAWYSTKGGPNALVRYGLDTGAMTTLGKDNFSSVGHIDWALGARDEPIAWRAIVGKPVVNYINPADPDAQLHKTLAAQFEGQDLRFISSSRDAQKLVFWVGSDRDPGTYYLFDRASGKAELLFVNMAQLDPEQMAERRAIRYKARDGLEIDAILTVPANPTNQKLPLIVMPHGGPFGIRDTWSFDTDAQFLASRGYAVLQPNFRGSSGRGEAFKEAGYQQWGGKLIDDMIDGVKFVGAMPDIDAKRICTFGGSYGGYAAMTMPIREPGMFKCAVGYAGRYELLKLGHDDIDSGEKGNQAYFRKTVGTDPEEMKRQSPAYNADKVKVPVMLIHGGKDKRCPVYEYEMMRDGLVKAGNVPETLFEPNEGHGFYDEQHRINMLEKLEAFLAKHLGK